MEPRGRRARTAALWGSLGMHGLVLLALTLVDRPFRPSVLGPSTPVEIEYTVTHGRPAEAGLSPLATEARARGVEGAAQGATTSSMTGEPDRPAGPARHSALATRGPDRPPYEDATRAPAATTTTATTTAAATTTTARGATREPRDARQPRAIPRPIRATSKAPIGEPAHGQPAPAPAPVDPRATPGPPAHPGAAPDLSPAAAAASLFAAQGSSAPRCPRPATATCDVGPTAMVNLDEHADGGIPPAQARLQAHLDQAARDVPHLSERPPPALRRNLDGDYHFDNAAIHATIRRDGSVEFEDKIGGVGPLPISGTFDLTLFVEKHILGKTVFAKEKAWFLRETADLRNRLTAAARAQIRKRGRLALRGQLLALLADPTLGPKAKRAAVFATWDTCAADEIGVQGQRIIEALIRERMPRGSPLAYSELELAELNTRRASPRPFQPYTADDAGMPPG